jgi:hypothetical protein
MSTIEIVILSWAGIIGLTVAVWHAFVTMGGGRQ